MQTNYYKDSFLDDLEVQKLQQFNDDEVMKEAVRKCLLSTVYERGVLKKGKKADPMHNFMLVFLSQNKSLTNELLGAHSRALFEGINFVEMGFADIAKYKKEPTLPPKGQNQAR